ncbi:hypothetical protein Ssi02_02020 [Sinosporangium siamense]|uniref:Uncharacterized protein n=2 Tax=Sinosporangium siamense TaxID=1367973 RepID=A0A919V4Q2_9ACTN|nr:hypothetical protein Ssi02_02020 [Sinosporangium siamense]
MQMLVGAVAVIAAAGLIAAALGGCGARKPQVHAVQQDRGELARIKGLLHDQRGLPEGFSSRPRDGWTTPFRPRDPHCRAVLDTAGGRPPKESLLAHAEATFPGRGLGEVVGVALAGYSSGGANRTLEELGSALTRCSSATNREFVGKNAGNGTKLKMRHLPMERVGESAVAAKVTGRLHGYPYRLHVVFVRIGETMISLAHTGVANLDPARTQQIARAVAERVASARTGT